MKHWKKKNYMMFDLALNTHKTTINMGEGIYITTIEQDTNSWPL